MANRGKGTPTQVEDRFGPGEGFRRGTGETEAEVDKAINSYIKSFTLPNYNISVTNIDTPFGIQQRNPMGGQDINRNFSDIAIEFTISDFKI